jgi:hypothetical protein
MIPKTVKVTLARGLFVINVEFLSIDIVKVQWSLCLSRVKKELLKGF